MSSSSANSLEVSAEDLLDGCSVESSDDSKEDPTLANDDSEEAVSIETLSSLGRLANGDTCVYSDSELATL
jgi:hypothetical protein